MNPAAILAALAQSQGGGSPAGGDPGAAVSQQLGALRSTNPEMVVQILRDMKQKTAALIPHTAETIPGVARYLASNLRGLDSAIEAATKALTAQTVAAGPLQMSAVSPMSGGGDQF